MWALLVYLWALVSASFRSLVGANTESRADFVAITDALQAELVRLAGQCATANERCDRFQTQLDATRGEVQAVRDENGELKRQLADCNRQLADCNLRHDKDLAIQQDQAKKIVELTERVNELAAKEAERKSKEAA